MYFLTSHFSRSVTGLFHSFWQSQLSSVHLIDPVYGVQCFLPCSRRGQCDPPASTRDRRRLRTHSRGVAGTTEKSHISPLVVLSTRPKLSRSPCLTLFPPQGLNSHLNLPDGGTRVLCKISEKSEIILGFSKIINFRVVYHPYTSPPHPHQM